LYLPTPKRLDEWLYKIYVVGQKIKASKSKGEEKKEESTKN
jgi:hypothetical protein